LKPQHSASIPVFEMYHSFSDLLSNLPCFRSIEWHTPHEYFYARNHIFLFHGFFERSIW
jgi:hypothetical protein